MRTLAEMTGKLKFSGPLAPRGRILGRCAHRSVVGGGGAAPKSATRTHPVALRPLLPLVLVTDEQRLADPCPPAARLPAGSLVILRHYGVSERRDLAERLARLCRARRLRLLVAGDLDLAVAVGAGVHLPEWLARLPQPRLRLWHRRRNGLLSVAAHGRMALVRAARLKADLALLSPVFPTASHPHSRGLGVLAFRRLVGRAETPVYALGGVNAATIRQLRDSGAAGVAAVSGLC